MSARRLKSRLFVSLPAWFRAGFARLGAHQQWRKHLPFMLMPWLLSGALMAAPANNETQKSPDPKAEQVRQLMDAAERQFSEDFEQAKAALNQAKALNQELSDTALSLELASLECWFIVERDINEARLFAETMMSSIDASTYPVRYAEMRLCWGYTSEQIGNLNEAAEAYEFAVSEGRRLNEPELLASALGSRGDLRSYRGDYSNALEDLKESYELYSALNDEFFIRYTLNSIANLYARIGEYPQAIEYYRELLVHDEQRGNPGAIAVTVYNIGRSLESKGDLEEARSHFERVVTLAQQARDGNLEYSARRSLASILLKRQQPKEALAILNEVIAFFERQKDPQMIAITRASRGMAFRLLGQPKAAIIDLDLALEEFLAGQNVRGIAEVELERAKTFAAAGEYEQAYQALSQHVQAHATLDLNLREEQTTRMRVLFDSEQKEKTNAALLREKALQQKQLEDSRRIRWLQSMILLLAVALIIVLLMLIAKHLRQSRRMSAMAMTDELTQLANRRHIFQFAEQQIAQSKRYRSPFTVLVMDIDYFKRINDTYGHNAGDLVLQKLAKAMSGELREGDKLGRTGGEEFMAVLPMTEYRSAMDVAERLKTAVAQLEFKTIDPALTVTVSIGVAQWREGDNNVSLIMRRADDALYRAKGAGRNKVELAD